MTRTKRLLFISLLMFASLCGARAANAADCKGAGQLTMSLAPCPISKLQRFQTSVELSTVATLGGKIPSEVFVEIDGTSPSIFSSTSFHANFINFTQLAISIGTLSSLGTGPHTGTLGIKLCVDKACSNVLVEASLPYSVKVLVPPVLTSLSPAAEKVGVTSFTLKVLGGGFTAGSTIDFGGTKLPATFVSVSQLTTKVDLSKVTKGQNYQVFVAPTGGFSSNAKPFTQDNPLPVMSVLTPSAATVGAAAFTLKVTGKNFVSTSKIHLGTTALTTTYVSSTQLRAKVDLSAVTAGTAYAVKVSSPTPGGGSSAQASFALNNAVPVLSALSPSKSAFNRFQQIITVTGTGFQHNSVIRWSGANLITSYVSATEVQAQTPFNALLTAGLIPVDVSTPAPGGGISAAATLEIDAPAPALTWVTPGRVYSGSGDVVVTVEGTNFINTTVLEWNGTKLAPLSAMTDSLGTVLQATLPKADLTSATTGTLSAFTPGPGGGTAGQSLTITQHPPEIDSLSPGFTAPGGGDFTLTLNGQDFDPAVVVNWNGVPLTPSTVSATQLQVTIPMADIANPGVASVTVVNPDAAGGTSAPASFAIDASGTAVISLAQPANDLEWDPVKAIFYGAIPASATTDPHSIATIDPIGAVITGSVDTTDEPILLSLSGDGQYLYAGFTSLTVGGHNSYGRYVLPAFSQDFSTSLPILSNGQPEYVKALQVSPIVARAYAVVVGETGFTTSNSGATFVLQGFDTWPGLGSEPLDTLGWSTDGTFLYGGDDETSTASFFSAHLTGGINPSAGGVDAHSAWTGTRLHVDQASGFIYADNSSAALNPTSGASVGTFPVLGVMVPDSALGCAYFITQTPAQVTAMSNDYTLSCYSTADFTTQTRSLVIPALNGTPTKMLRWGNEGLVIQTTTAIYFVSGQVVTGN